VAVRGTSALIQRNETTWREPSGHTRTLVVAAILLLALGLRLAGILPDLPFSYHGDELHLVKRSMAMGTGDLNPHWFHKPAFLMYLLLLCYGTYYVAGHALGAFGSPEEFGAYFLNEPGNFVLIGRLLVLAFGVATVYVVYRIARRAFRSFPAAAAAAAVAAFFFPLVAGSQSVKADVPAAFFVALSFLWFLRSRDDGRFRSLAVASLLAGVAMGTKYYGALLMPGYCLLELATAWTRKAPFRAALGRATLAGVLFFAGFFVTSPYNFLDPMWLSSTLGNVQEASGLAEGTEVFRADTQVSYRTGPGAIPGATLHLAKQAVHPRALGIPLGVLVLIGLVVCLASRRLRRYGVYIAFPLLGFWLLSVTLNAYHANWRHFNAVAPLLCTLVFPACSFLLRTVRFPRAGAAVAVALLAVAPSAVEAFAHTASKARPDSRTVAHDWIVASLPADARYLVDEYGPVLQPAPAAVARLRERLGGLPRDEAFTRHQAERLDLLEKHPGRHARDFDELAHPWWLPREMTDEELRASPEARDMGNPLKLRAPKSLAEYRAEGVRFVVTNSGAQERYLADPEAEESFPSFVAFYRELKSLEPVRTFDPADFGGKGPVVWIYDLERRP